MATGQLLTPDPNKTTPINIDSQGGGSAIPAPAPAPAPGNADGSYRPSSNQDVVNNQLNSFAGYDSQGNKLTNADVQSGKVLDPTYSPYKTGGSTPAPVPGSPGYFSRSSALDDAENSLLGKIANAPAPLTEDQLVQKYRSEAQTQIDAINANYDQIVATDEKAGKVLEDQTNAENAARGLAGSEDANTAMQGTKDKNADVVKADNVKRSLAISAILGSVNDQARAEADKERTDALNQAQTGIQDIEAIRASRQASQEKAVANFSQLASLSRVDFATFQKMSPDAASALLKQTGYDPFTAEMTWNGAKDAAHQIKYVSSHYDPNTGEYVVNGVDPSKQGQDAFVEKRFPADPNHVADFGQLATTPYNDPASGKTFFLPKKIDLSKPLMDQAVWWDNGKLTKVSASKASGGGEKVTSYETDSAGKVWKITKQGGNETSRTEEKGTIRQQMGQDITDFRDEFKKVKGDDQKIPPDVYRQAMDSWIQTYGSATGFKTNFPVDQYLAPENQVDDLAP